VSGKQMTADMDAAKEWGEEKIKDVLRYLPKKNNNAEKSLF